MDYVKQDMVIGILGGEEDLRREFIGLLKEYKKRRVMISSPMAAGGVNRPEP